MADPSADPSAATTLAIVAGASEFPNAPTLAQGPAFRASADDFIKYLRDPDGFALQDENLLVLFDATESAAPQLKRMRGFLTARAEELKKAGTEMRDLLFYYVGHGGLTPSNDYYLAIKETTDGLEGPSSIHMNDLATMIRDNTGGKIRKYLILDCCFAARAFKEFQSTAKDVMLAKTGEILTPSTGTTMLCSSSAQKTSTAPEGAAYTMFSGALLQALRDGMPRVNRRISMAQLGQQVAELIKRQYSEKAVRPEVLSPDQPEDTVQDVPLFPNPALKLRNFDCTITVIDNLTLSLECVNEQGKPERVEGRLADPLALLTVQRLHEWINMGLALEQEKTWRGNYKTDDLKVLGANLFRALFGDEKVRKSFCGLYERFQTAAAVRKTPGFRMRLRLTFPRAADDVARLPWEFLFVPDGERGPLDTSFFGGRRSDLLFTRYVPPSADIAAPKVEKLRILVAIYTPNGESGIGAVEQESLLAKLRRIPNTDVTVLEDVSIRKLGSTLEDLTPHVLHFVGYGSRDDRGGLTFVGQPDDPEARVYLPDDKIAQPLTGDDVLSLFSYDAKPGVVFLHGCKTPGNPADGVKRQEGLKKCARDLSAARIPSVMTMQFALSHDEIGDFAAAVYKDLARGVGPDEAVQSGRVALGQIFPRWTHPRFGAPLVYLQNDEPLVLPPPTEPGTTEKSARKDDREPAPAGGGGASTVGPRAGVTETPAEVAPAPAPKDQEATSSSFKGR
ncbi:MAG TPA: CHAT domain-containing protein [Vicinamibacterales bacterium]|nr:CHAT domain-containing protein [Vicinamibacterales bacterium]